MSSKRKWADAPEDGESPAKVAKVEEGKSPSNPAAAAAAIAAKIAAQFSAGTTSNGGSTPGQKDPFDAEFTHDIDINDVRNRYMLTKGSTQTQVCLFLQFDVSLFRLLSVAVDSRRDWSLHQHEGCVVSRPGKGD